MSLSNTSEGIQLSDIRIGVDLGGTKIEALALNDDGTVALRRRIATPRDDYPATLEAIANLVTSIEKELKRHGKVGIGTTNPEKILSISWTPLEIMKTPPLMPSAF